MLNPLRNNPLVVKATEEVGQVLIRGVKGQLGEGQQGDGTPHLFRFLLLEVAVRYVGQHVQRVVKVLRVPLHWRQVRPGRERRCVAVAREGEGAN